MGETKTICQPSHEARSVQFGHHIVSSPLAPVRGRSLPLLRAHFSSTNWQWEYAHRLARIFRCVDRGLASGKPLHGILVWFAWRWKGRHYSSDPSRRIRFGYGTLRRKYREWKAAGRNPEALALRYRAPVKLRPGHVQQFAGLCIYAKARSFAEAYGSLPRPRATVSAYRLALGARLLRRVVNLFAARRLVDVRTRKARTAANRFATEGAR
jgi:hypothetical protein